MVSAFDGSPFDHATVGNILLDGAIRWLAGFDGGCERLCQRLGQCIDHFEPEGTIDLCFKVPKAIGDHVWMSDLDTVLGILVALQSKFVAFDLLEVVAGQVVENHGLGLLDLALRPPGTSSISCRLPLAVFGSRLHDTEKSADPIDLYIHRLTEKLEALHCFGAGLPLLFDLVLDLVEQSIQFAV